MPFLCGISPGGETAFLFPESPMRTLASLSAILVLLSQVAHAQEAGSLAGTVLDAATGHRLGGANVVVAGTSFAGMTAADGTFLFYGVLPGSYSVNASFVGYAPDSARVEVVPGQTAAVTLRLVPAPVQFQPITVSATRARDRETPATFTTLGRAEIRERYSVQDIPVLLSELPSTTVYSEAGNGIGYTYLNIRGFDARRIAVMINGIPQNDPEDHNVYWLDFPDVAASLEDIQVQRGAGSAFYGSPAIGGSVNLVTESFGRERSFEVSAGVGSYTTRKYGLSYTSGLFGERYAVHTRLSRILSSGYRDRSWVDFTGYFAGVMRFDSGMTTQLNIYGGPVADHLAYYGVPKSAVKDRAARRDNPILREEEIENFSQPHYELLHEWRMTPALTLNNALFLVTGDGFFDYDGSWAPYSYFRLTPEFGFPVAGDPDTLYFGSALIRAYVSNRQYGWLPRLTWEHGGGRMIAGAEIRLHRSLHWGRLQRADGIPGGSTAVPEDYRYYEYQGGKDVASLYVHELLDLAHAMKLMLNLQYVFNRYRLFNEKFVGTDFTVPYHFMNPRIGLNYNVTELWNVYAGLAYTSREPRLKNLYDAAEASTPAGWGAVLPQFAVDGAGRFDFSQPLVRPEALYDVELGAGFRDRGNALGVNLYWMEFRNEIVRSGQVDRFGQPITGNAGRTRHIGIEISGNAVLGDFEAGGNLMLSRNRFVHHTDYSTGSALELDGHRIAGFPDVLANLHAAYRWNDLAVRLTGRYAGKQYTDNFENEEHTVDPSFVVNGALAFTLHGLAEGVDCEARLQVNNIFDLLYANYGEGADFFVAAERNLFFTLALTF
jgi:iron complex outermembrane recepter protein